MDSPIELSLSYHGFEVKILVGLQGCPNSIDLDSFSLIYVNPGFILSPDLLDFIDKSVVDFLKTKFKRDDVETNIVLADSDIQAIIWSSRGSADGANLIPQTIDYWHPKQNIVKIRKIKRSVLMGIFETFNKLNLCLLKTSFYLDQNLPNYYGEGLYKNKIQHLVKHDTLGNLLDFYQNEVNFENLFSPEYRMALTPNQILNQQSKELKIPKITKIIQKKEDQLTALLKLKRNAKIDQTIGLLEDSIQVMKNHISKLTQDLNISDDRKLWSAISGCKKIAFQLVKACLLLLGYEAFTKEVDIPEIPSLPFIRGLIPLMNRRVNLTAPQRNDSLAQLEQAKKFLCNEVRFLLEKIPNLALAKGKNYYPPDESFIINKNPSISNKNTFIQVDVSSIQFPLEDSKQITSEMLTELHNSPMYDQCQILSDRNIGNFLVTICSKCFRVTRIADLPFQKSFKRMVYCSDCYSNTNKI